MGVGMGEMVLIFLVAVVVLGPSRLPGISRAIGRGVQELRKGMREIEASLEVAPCDDGGSRPVKDASGAMVGKENGAEDNKLG